LTLASSSLAANVSQISGVGWETHQVPPRYHG
jgi:hypothetical protein